MMEGTDNLSRALLGAFAAGGTLGVINAGPVVLHRDRPGLAHLDASAATDAAR